MLRFEITAEVSRVMYLSGSFVNVWLCGHRHMFTCGIGERLEFPAEGETITVRGVINDVGRHLTESWEVQQ